MNDTDLNQVFSPLFSGDPSLSLIVVGVIGISIVFFFLAMLSMMAYFPTLLSIAGYSYPVARVKAIGTRYVYQKPVMHILESGIYSDALARIQSHGYRIDIAGGGNLSEIEHGCSQILLHEIEYLVKTVPVEISAFFFAYLELIEIIQLKKAIRMIHHRMLSSEIRAGVHEIGSISSDLVNRISECTSIDELVTLMSGTKWGLSLMRARNEYHETGSLFPLEIALDHSGYSRLSGSTLKVSSSLYGPYREFTSIMIDIGNISSLLRAKHAGCDPEMISTWLMEGGLRFPHWRLLQLNEMLSVPDLVIQMMGTGYDRILDPFMKDYPSPESFHLLDHAIDEFLLHEVSKMSLVSYHTGGPLIEFLVTKEIEVRNIRIILSGLASGLKTGDILPHLTFREAA